jgi:hypothetical protein
MVAMDRFDHILNWTLKQGSHVFPGKDGGTCINEAAVVVAGFPYRPVRTVDDMPGCFSHPICRLAMQLNDEATDEERQFLLPFVTRLACADTAEVERRRQAYINSVMPYRISFQDRLDVLDGALAIGRQADLFPSEAVRTRLEAAQQGANTATSVADDAVFSQVKTWFGPFHLD